jgi:hypothetical protein
VQPSGHRSTREEAILTRDGGEQIACELREGLLAGFVPGQVGADPIEEGGIGRSDLEACILHGVQSGGNPTELLELLFSAIAGTPGRFRLSHWTASLAHRP